MRISDLSSDVCSSDLPQLSPTRLQDTPYLNFPLRNLNPDAVDVLSDDQVLLSMQYSTQWDSLAHVGALFDADGDGRAELCYYNGYRAGTDIVGPADGDHVGRSEEHTSELQSLMRISYAVFCLKKKKKNTFKTTSNNNIYRHNTNEQQ